MTILSMTDARLSFSEMANKVIYGGERIYVKKNGKVAFALVSIEDVELLEMLEDKADADAMRKALKESGGSLSWRQAKKELGL